MRRINVGNYDLYILKTILRAAQNAQSAMVELNRWALEFQTERISSRGGVVIGNVSFLSGEHNCFETSWIVNSRDHDSKHTRVKAMFLFDPNLNGYS